MSKYGLEKYIEDEIKPAIKAMEDKGFGNSKDFSFAFPHGQSTPEINTAMLKYFHVIRGTDCSNIPGEFEIPTYKGGEKYVRGHLLLNGRLSVEYMDKFLKKNIEDGTITLWWGHGISSDEDKGRLYPNSNYQLFIDSTYLKEVIDTAKKQGLKFYTMSELAE